MALDAILTKTPKVVNTALLASKVQVTATEATYAKRLYGFHINSNDVAATATIYLHDGTLESIVGTVAVPPIATTINGTVNIMTSLSTLFTTRDSCGNLCYDLPVGAYFSVQISAITGGKYMNCTTFSQLFDPNVEGDYGPND